MDRRSHIEARLRAALAASHVDVADESHLHAGHAGAASGGGHFRATIVSERFAGLSRVARQRLVYERARGGDEAARSTRSRCARSRPRWRGVGERSPPT